jgi:hypothetical protein
MRAQIANVMTGGAKFVDDPALQGKAAVVARHCDAHGFPMISHGINVTSTCFFVPLNFSAGDPILAMKEASASRAGACGGVSIEH